MFRFDDSVGLVADEALVWGRVADVERMGDYWSSIKSLQLVSTGKRPNPATVTFSDGTLGSAAVALDDQNRELIVFYESGPWKGTQRMEVRNGRLKIVWDLNIGGFLRSIREGTKLKTETIEALEKLAGLHEALV